MNVEEILQSVCTHFIAVKTNEELIGSTPNSKQVHFSRKVSRENQEENKNNKKNFNIPPLPKDLKDVVSNKVFFCIMHWW